MFLTSLLCNASDRENGRPRPSTWLTILLDMMIVESALPATNIQTVERAQKDGMSSASTAGHMTNRDVAIKKGRIA